jgi:hypothetical protein
MLWKEPMHLVIEVLHPVGVVNNKHSSVYVVEQPRGHVRRALSLVFLIRRCCALPHCRQPGESGCHEQHGLYDSVVSEEKHRML